MKVLCKRNLLKHIRKGKWYNVLGQSDGFYRIISDCEYYGEFAVNCDFFYTIKELRKDKLLKLNNI
jgi:hypothetical protein